MLKFTTCSLLSALLIAAGASSSYGCPACDGPIVEAQPPAPMLAVCPAPPEEVVEVLHPHDDPVPPQDPAPQPDAGEPPLIQIALLLDTSNSMDGLITQAKAQLWTIVNRFAKARRDGEAPRFQIALFEYGNTSLPAEEGYLRQVVGFTDDLDAVSAALFGLTTNGGDEYCGQVIAEALHRLPWSVNGNDFKAIYIAGNEPFTQGRLDYKTPCEEAAARGVLVNTIHCGPEQEGIQGKWLHGAQIAGGSYLTINQDRAVAHIQAPQDEEILLLNRRLNTTYIPYGEAGEENQQRQQELDVQNEALSADAGASRAGAKASELYFNGSWDLVDASTQDDFDLASIPDEELPEAMRGMTLEEKQAYIDAMAADRAQVQEQIQELSRQRAEHVAGERERLAEEQGNDLGTAFLQSVDDQLRAYGFETEDSEEAAPAGDDEPTE